MINMAEFRKKSKEELKKELGKIELEYRKVVGDILQRKEKNVKKSGSFRKDIARIETLLSEKKKDKEIVVLEKKEEAKPVKEAKEVEKKVKEKKLKKEKK